MEVETQVTIASGLPAFTVVGLPDKAVAESRERVRAALPSLGLALPASGSPSTSPRPTCSRKEPFRSADRLGAAGGDGGVAGRRDRRLYRARRAGARRLDDAGRRGIARRPCRGRRKGGIICPAACGGEAAWAGEIEIIAAPSLLAIVNHFKGTQLLPPPEPRLAARPPPGSISATSRARRAPSARSKSPRPAATIS